jgi:hypothetical protein
MITVHSAENRSSGEGYRVPVLANNPWIALILATRGLPLRPHGNASPCGA